MLMTIKADLLDVDKEIAGQKWVCLSFVSPEYVIKDKNIYYLEQFIKNYDLTKSMSKFTEFINYISFKYNFDPKELMEEFNSFTKEKQEELTHDMSDDYKNFLDKNEDELQKTYSKEHNFQTSTRGIKVRGTYSTYEECAKKGKELRDDDPAHDVYTAPVGTWVPFHPEAYKTGDVQYLEKELNDLMHERKINDDKAKKYNEERVKNDKIKAIEQNIELAKKTNNVLTQSINDKGELVNLVNTDVEQEPVLGMSATLDEIREAVFNNADPPTQSSSTKLDTVSEETSIPPETQIEKNEDVYV